MGHSLGLGPSKKEPFSSGKDCATQVEAYIHGPVLAAHPKLKDHLAPRRIRDSFERSDVILVIVLSTWKFWGFCRKTSLFMFFLFLPAPN